MAEPIPFTNNQASGVEPLAGATVLAMNVIVDAAGAVSRRPGIRNYYGSPDTALSASGVNGLFCTDDGVLLAVTEAPGRALYEVSSASYRKVVPLPPGNARPTFAQTEMLVCVAGGAQIIKYERLPRTGSFLGGSPPPATHVIAHSQRLLANDVSVDRTAVRYSGQAIGNTSFAGFEDWALSGTAGYILSKSKPDNVVALGENSTDVFVFCQNSLEIYGQDPNLVFAIEAAREYGCGAPYSVIKQDQAFAWLDQFGRFILSDGREYKVISEPIFNTLEQIADRSDCFGYRVLRGNCDCLVWTFPSAGLTFAYQTGSGWGQWSGWDPATANFSPFTVLSHHLRQDTDVNVVGTTAGYIGELTTETQTDLGVPIRAHIETGYVARGTDQKKHCKCVRLVFRRGTVTGSTGPQAWLYYRDQPGDWEPGIPIDLGGSTDTHPVLEFRSLGVYRRRQWKFEFTGTSDLVLVSASEDFQVLEQ